MCINKDDVDVFFKIAIPTVAVLYFLYQAFSGSFFATTSIFLEANRDVNNPCLVIVKATIERGDNWLVEIEDGSDEYLITTKVEDQADQIGYEKTWEKINFPRRYDGNKNKLLLLGLAPKEKTQATFFINEKEIKDKGYDPSKGFFLTAKVKYSSVGWPIEATSFSKIYVPPIYK